MKASGLAALLRAAIDRHGDFEVTTIDASNCELSAIVEMTYISDADYWSADGEWTKMEHVFRLK